MFNRPLVPALVLAVLVLSAALAWRFYGSEIIGKNTHQAVAFTPLTGPLEVRVRDEIAKQLPQQFQSDKPVSLSYQTIPFAQTTTPVREEDHDPADNHSHVRTLPVKKAYLVRMENPDLCHNGACPILVVAAGENPQSVQNILTTITAKSIEVIEKNGKNPDLLVDYGIGAPVLLTWSADEEFPTYVPAPSAAE